MKKLVRVLALGILLTIGAPFLSDSAKAAWVDADCAGEDQWRVIPPSTNTPSGPDFGITGTNMEGSNMLGTAWDYRSAVVIRGMSNEVRINQVISVNTVGGVVYRWDNNWFSLGGATYKYPKVEVINNNALRVWVVGTDGNTYHRTWNGSGWNAWVAHSVGQNAYNNTFAISFIYLGYTPPGDVMELSLYLGVPIYWCRDS